MTTQEQVDVAGGGPYTPTGNSDFSTKDHDEDRARNMDDRIHRSESWLELNYWPMWERTWESYSGYRQPITLNDPTIAPPMNLDGAFASDSVAILRQASSRIKRQDRTDGLPVLWNACQRMVARVNANVPIITCRSQDTARADRLSASYMYFYDKAQRKSRVVNKTLTSAWITGWGPNSWGWDDTTIKRVRLVRPERMTDDMIAAVLETYEPQLVPIIEDIANAASLDPNDQEAMDDAALQAIPVLAQQYGHKGRLRIIYDERGYVGPSVKYTFPGDIFPEPEFDTLSTCAYVGEYMRVGIEWFQELYERHKLPDGNYDPDLARRIELVMTDKPNGEPRGIGTQSERLRLNMYNLVKRSAATNPANESVNSDDIEVRWSIHKIEYPGRGGDDATVEYKCGDIWLGHFYYPYLIGDGKIARTELRIVDNILGGPGDSPAHHIVSLADMYAQSFFQRHDLIDAISRPLLWTDDAALWSNPEFFTRNTSGFRVVYTRGGGKSFGFEQSGPAIASALSSMNTDESSMKLISSTVGDNNLSNMAELQPNQNDTATGARIMDRNAAIMSGQTTSMFVQKIGEDCEMMRELLRSELNEDLALDLGQYHLMTGQSSQLEDVETSMVTMEPEDYEDDGEIIVDSTSMFPDAKMNKVNEANLVYGLAKENPDKMHIDEAIKDVLKAMGKGKDIERLMIPPPPPGSPAQANPMAALQGLMGGKGGPADGKQNSGPPSEPGQGPANTNPTSPVPGGGGGGKPNGIPPITVPGLQLPGNVAGGGVELEGQLASRGGVPLT